MIFTLLLFSSRFLSLELVVLIIYYYYIYFFFHFFVFSGVLLLE